jgi:hypothetical protein
MSKKQTFKATIIMAGRGGAFVQKNKIEETGESLAGR